MKYMILDSRGNAVDAFSTQVAARATLRAIVAEEPDAADELVLLAYNAEGRPVGEAATFYDLAPAATIKPSWPVVPSSGGDSRVRRIRWTGRDYVDVVGVFRREPLVRETAAH